MKYNAKKMKFALKITAEKLFQALDFYSEKCYNNENNFHLGA
jgi:hypothetical protein